MKRKLYFNDAVIEYDETGDGRPLILLHGYLEAKEVWHPLAELLRKHFRVIAVDLPGHGGSATVGEIHTMEFLADAVKEVILVRGAEKAIMAGHSLGGYVTLAFVERYPDLLSGYVLFHSHANADAPEAIEKRMREISIVRAGKKDIMYPANIAMMFAEKNLQRMEGELERLKKIASCNSAEGIIALLKGMMKRPERTSIVENGTVPMLWILGRWDKYFSPEKALGNLKIPGNGRIAVLEESGHLGFVEEPERSAELIKEFGSLI